VLSKPAINLRTVVFPEPDGPSIEKNSPACTSKSKLATAWTSSKNLLTPRSETKPALNY
jgi:hypothetical protein